MTRLGWFAVLAVVAVLVTSLIRGPAASFDEIPYSELKEGIAEGLWERVEIGTREVIAVPVDEDDTPVRADMVAQDETLVPLLDEHAVEYVGVPESGCGGPAVFSMIWLFLLFGFILWSMRRAGAMGAQAMSFGKSKAKLYAVDRTGVDFEDVAGCEEAKEELMEMVQFLKNPGRFHAVGARMPKGVLLMGAPGTGKTLMAKAVAGEAGVPFFSISGSDFVEMFVGVGAARVRDLFQQAKEKAPCIIFLDEIDAVGKMRGAGGPQGGNDERENTLNALLVEMDGFDSQTSIIILAATNRPEILDPALLRPGRFDRQVVIDRPDRAGREAILKIHVERVPLGPDINLANVARDTTGMVGADLANLVNEAALLAARRGADAVSMEDFNEAIERVVAGLKKKNSRLTDHEKRRVAYHEAGHAIVAASQPGADPVRRISIVPRGVSALGYTIQAPEEDRHLMTRTELEGRLALLMGGRAAEEIIFGEVSTGAQDDIARATDLARQMVTDFGMSDAVGVVHIGRRKQRSSYDMPNLLQEPFADTTMQKVDEETRTLTDAAMQTALEVLNRERALLDEMAQRLLEEEILDTKDIQPMLARVRRVRDPLKPHIINGARR